MQKCATHLDGVLLVVPKELPYLDLVQPGGMLPQETGGGGRGAVGDGAAPHHGTHPCIG